LAASALAQPILQARENVAARRRRV